MTSLLARRELDRQLREVGPVRSSLSMPSAGWIRAIREALGMSQRALARRIGKSQAAINGYEKRESLGNLQLSTLAEVAAALNCQLVYGFIPLDGSLEDVVNAEAKAKAIAELAPLAQTMKLESQGIDDQRMQEAVSDRAAQIIADKRVWKS